MCTTSKFGMKIAAGMLLVSIGMQGHVMGTYEGGMKVITVGAGKEKGWSGWFVIRITSTFIKGY